MQAYQHILTALNYSRSDDVVIQKGLELANLSQAKLSIIHILDDIPMPDTAYGTCISIDETSDNHLLEIEKQRLIQIADRLGIPHAQFWLVWGYPQQEITLLAEQQKVDLIVLC